MPDTRYLDIPWFLRLNPEEARKEMSEQNKDYLDPGTLLGLCDSEGNEFYVGAKVKRKCECNPEVHGAWVVAL